MRKITTDPFAKVMISGQSAIAMDCSASKGFSNWVNKDLKKVEATGDWSELLAKASKSTRIFRNHFYS
jgi:hypothetical protein